MISWETSTCSATQSKLSLPSSRGEKTRYEKLPPPNKYKPLLECLEDRLCPAVSILTWTGLSDNTWSNANNWVDAQQNHAIPDSDDQVIFDPTYNRAAIVDSNFAGTVGKITINPNYTQQITLERNIIVAETVQFGGTIFGSYSYIVPTGGTYDWIGGTLRGFGNPLALTVVQTGATMNIFGVASTLDGRALQISGTVNWLTGLQPSILTVNNSGLLSVQGGGLFAIPNAGAFSIAGDGTGSVSDSGIFRVGNTVNLTVNIPFTIGASGTLDLAGANAVMILNGTGTFQDKSQIIGQGRLDVFGDFNVPTGTATVSKAVLVAKLGSHINSPGTLDFLADSTFRIEGTILDGNLVKIENGAILDINGNLGLINSVTLLNLGSAIWRSGVINLGPATTSLINRNLFQIASQINLTMAGAGTFNNERVGGLTGSVRVDQPVNNTVTINNPFANSGTLTLNSGTLVISNHWTVPVAGIVSYNGGNLRVQGTLTNNGTLNVYMNATIEANLVQNNGLIDLLTDAPNALTIAGVPGIPGGGNFTQGATGTLRMEITGNAGADLISLAGVATFGGTLDVRLGNNYQPAGGVPLTWNLINYGQRNGQFATVNKPLRFTLPVYGQQSMSITWSLF